MKILASIKLEANFKNPHQKSNFPIWESNYARTLWTLFLILLSTLSYAQCEFTVQPTSGLEGCFSSRTPVVWQDGVNLTISGNEITKTSGNNNWNAGAISTSRIYSNGSLEYTVESGINRSAIGLSAADNNVHFNTIDYAFYFDNGSTLRIYENGANRGNFGSYAPGDIIEILFENSTIKYYRNGVLLRTQSTPNSSFLIDASIRDQGRSLNGIEIVNEVGLEFEALSPQAGSGAVYSWDLNGTPIGGDSPTLILPSAAENDALTCVITYGTGGCGDGSETANTLILNSRTEIAPAAFYITNTTVSTGCIQATEFLEWDPLSFVNTGVIANNGLQKITGGNNWNAGVSSLNRVANNGYLEFTATEVNRRRMIGLSANDVNVNFNSIQFAFYLDNNNTLRIYESGSNRGNFGSYQAGDIFRIAIEENEIRYYRNGELLRIANNAPTPPLLVDISFRDNGASIENLEIRNNSSGFFTAETSGLGANPNFQWILNDQNVGANSSNYSNANLGDGDVLRCEVSPDLSSCAESTFSSENITISENSEAPSLNFYIAGVIAPSGCNNAEENVVWNESSLENIADDGNSLVKIQGGNNWNAGAASLGTVGEGGLLEFTATETNTRRMIGLSASNVNANFNTIQYAIYLDNNGTLRIYESGTNRGTFGNYATDDILRIAINDGSVKYYRNGNLLRIANAAPNPPLLVDVSMRDQGSTVSNVVIRNPNAGSFNAFADNAGASPTYQWKLNGANVGTNSTSFSDPNIQSGDVVTCEITPDLNGCSNDSYTSNTIEFFEIPESDALNFFISGLASSDACNSAGEDVVWNVNELQNLESSDGVLTKIQGGNNWNGGAASLNRVANNGYLEFQSGQSNSRKMIGLSTNNANSNFNSIRYAFNFEANGTLRIYESGANRGNFGTYTGTDIFRIAIENNEVKYYQNGNLLRISTLVPNPPLLVDVSFRDQGASLSGAEIWNLNTGSFTASLDDAVGSASYQWQLNGTNVGTDSPNYSNPNLNDGDEITCILSPNLGGCSGTTYFSNSIELQITEVASSIRLYAEGVAVTSGFGFAEEEVVWNGSNSVNIEITGSSIEKVQGGNSWNAGVSAYNSVSNNGYFIFSSNQVNADLYVGLSATDPNVNTSSIRYAFNLRANGSLRIYENGANRGTFGNYNTNDELEVRAENNIISYYRNGDLLYTSNVTPSFPLIPDVSIRNSGGGLSNAIVSNPSDGNFIVQTLDAGDNPSYQWKLNGANVGPDNSTYTNADIVDGDVITVEVTPDFDGCTGASFESNEIRIIGPDAYTEWTGAISSNWHNSGNWSNGVPNNFNDAGIPAVTTNDPVITANASARNLTVETGANLIVATSALLLYGNLNNKGSFLTTLGILTLTGGGDTFITGNSIRCYRLAVNKSQSGVGVFLETDLEITNEILFINGIIYTDLNEVIYLDGSDNRSGSNNSYVDGIVRKVGNSEFTFPVGSDSLLAPIGISAPDLATDEFSARYFREDPELAGYNTSEIEDGITNVSRCEYWILDRDQGNASVTVSLNYDNERSCGIVDPSELAVMRWNGIKWDSHGLASYSGDALAGTITSGEEIENFSPFTFGSGSFINPLPIDLLEFSAEIVNKNVELRWRTATETNNDYFMLERSSDGYEWKEIGRIQGAGTSNTTLSYVQFDDAPLNGISYYRLSQTDFDGSREYFDPKSVIIQNPLEVRLYPNPNDGNFEIQLNSDALPAQLRLINQSGLVVWESYSNQSRTRVNREDLAPGIYFLEATSIKLREVIKAVVR